MRRFITLPLIWTVATAALAAAPQPARADGPDASSTSPAAADGADAATGECVLEHASVREAILGAYEELRRIHRAALPGPRGRELVDRRVDALVTRSIHVETFARRVLRQLWPLTTPEQREAWRDALEQMLRRRYLRGLDEPNRHQVEVQRADVSCRTATVRIALIRISDREERLVDMDLVFADGGWRVYDVTLDGVSLVRTWRSRFARVHADGGLEAVDAEMKAIAERYRARDTRP